MCKPKSQLIPSVWRHTDYVAFRFDYYSIGPCRDEIAAKVQEQFPSAIFKTHKLQREDLEIVNIDSLAYNLHLSLDEVNNETVYHFIYNKTEAQFVYELYVGRYFTQLIYKKKEISSAEYPDFADMTFLLDYLLRTEKLNMGQMTCIAHTIMEDSRDEVAKVTEPVVLSELCDNNVSKNQYTDTRVVGEMTLESKRTVNRSSENQYKLEIMGASYYSQLTKENFLNSYMPLMLSALLENTRYFVQ